jgi:hypothetical protein
MRTKKKRSRLPDSIRTLQSYIVFSARKHCHCVPTAYAFQKADRDACLGVASMIRERYEKIILCPRGGGAWHLLARTDT